MSQLQYIRRTYNVPAFRGVRIRFTGGAEPIEGRIVYARGAHLGVKFDGESIVRTVHPTQEIEYLRDPCTSPPHAKSCCAMRPDRFSADCDCGFFGPTSLDQFEPLTQEDLSLLATGIVARDRSSLPFTLIEEGRDATLKYEGGKQP